MRYPSVPLRSPSAGVGDRPARLRRVIAAGAPVLAALAAACGGGGERPPNVVLVTLDTVRADHLSCYGYPLPTSPAIDALAARSDRYATCRSTASWTIPSHASLFTGRYTFQHQADAGLREGAFYDALPLAGEHHTLAEALAAEGYRTGAFVTNNVYLSPTFGFDQGFETYDVERVRAPAVNRKVRGWLDALGEEPFFLFVNYMDAHRPYNVEPLPPGRAGSLPPPAPEPPGELLDRLYETVMPGKEPLPRELIAKAITQYDTAIAHLDLAIGELVAELEERGLYEDTLIVVTSDHGEYFGEHGLVEHSKDIYEPALRVPLIVKRPGQRKGRVIEDPVSLVDVPRIVAAGLPGASGRRVADGFPYAPGNHSLLAENRFSRTKDLAQPWGARFQRERAVLFAAPWKLILSSDGANELYDLGEDPGEAVNLIGEQPRLAAALQGHLLEFLEREKGTAGAAEPVVLGERELEELRALGYLGE